MTNTVTCPRPLCRRRRGIPSMGHAHIYETCPWAAPTFKSRFCEYPAPMTSTVTCPRPLFPCLGCIPSLSRAHIDKPSPWAAPTFQCHCFIGGVWYVESTTDRVHYFQYDVYHQPKQTNGPMALGPLQCPDPDQ
jgi:hypothetical protein